MYLLNKQYDYSMIYDIKMCSDAVWIDNRQQHDNSSAGTNISTVHPTAALQVAVSTGCRLVAPSSNLELPWWPGVQLGRGPQGMGTEPS